MKFNYSFFIIYSIIFLSNYSILKKLNKRWYNNNNHIIEQFDDNSHHHNHYTNSHNLIKSNNHDYNHNKNNDNNNHLNRKYRLSSTNSKLNTSAQSLTISKDAAPIPEFKPKKEGILAYIEYSYHKNKDLLTCDLDNVSNAVLTGSIGARYVKNIYVKSFWENIVKLKISPEIKPEDLAPVKAILSEIDVIVNTCGSSISKDADYVKSAYKDISTVSGSAVSQPKEASERSEKKTNENKKEDDKKDDKEKEKKE